MTDLAVKRVHFIGIGGVGMSGIARVAHDQGMLVSGSDLKESRYTKQLKEAGIKVFIGHSADNIPEPHPDVVVVSTAILENNPELIQAKNLDLPIWHRAKMLAALGRGKQTLAVAGTHGKTTTSSMLASTLDDMGEDPSFLIGGIVCAYGTNAHSGEGPWYAVEADESDKSFTYLDPQAILVTNIEADHLDHYADLQEIHGKFKEFIASVPKEGVCVVCGEDEALVEVSKAAQAKVYTYGFGERFDISITAYEPVGVGSDFTCVLPDGSHIKGHLKQNPGRHNVLNAAGVIGLIGAIGLSAQDAAQSLARFSGVRRRFEHIGEAQGVTVVDDYAHHPTEIAATIAAAKNLDFKRVHAIFQPHRYSRASLFTEVLHDEFAQAFNRADTLTFMDVYSAGEMPIPGISGKTFMDVVMSEPDHPEVHYIPQRMELVPHMLTLVEPGDLVITMGAGDVTAIAPQIIAALQAE